MAHADHGDPLHLVLRRDRVDADHFHTPAVLPVIGSLSCAVVTTPGAGRPTEQYRISGVLLAIGVVPWGVTVLINRRTGAAVPALDPDRFTQGGPVN